MCNHAFCRAATVAFAGIQAASFHAANADVMPSLVLTETSIITIEFVSRSAGWVGELSLLSPEPTTLLRNDANPGDSISLGVVEAGEELIFGYEIIQGGNHFWRADRPHANDHFRFTPILSGDFAGSTLLQIEDLPRGRSDMDFNDAVFRLSFEPTSSPVPEPGAIAALGFAGVVVSRRRRR
jgi:hypothetical protein